MKSNILKMTQSELPIGCHLVSSNDIKSEEIRLNNDSKKRNSFFNSYNYNSYIKC